MLCVSVFPCLSEAKGRVNPVCRLQLWSRIIFHSLLLQWGRALGSSCYLKLLTYVNLWWIDAVVWVQGLQAHETSSTESIYISFWPSGLKQKCSDLYVWTENTNFGVEQNVLFDFKCSGFACVYKYRKSGSKGLDSFTEMRQFISSKIVGQKSWTLRDPNSSAPTVSLGRGTLKFSVLRTSL